MHWHSVREPFPAPSCFDSLVVPSLTSISLAKAEILLVIATIFREFEMELYETTFEDVRVVRDMFNGHPRKGSEGVRALITRWNGRPGSGSTSA